MLYSGVSLFSILLLFGFKDTVNAYGEVWPDRARSGERVVTYLSSKLRSGERCLIIVHWWVVSEFS